MLAKEIVAVVRITQTRGHKEQNAQIVCWTEHGVAHVGTIMIITLQLTA